MFLTLIRVQNYTQRLTTVNTNATVQTLHVVQSNLREPITFDTANLTPCLQYDMG